jgi:hypothetical protein
VYLLSFVVELFVGEEAGVESSLSGVANLLIFRLFRILLSNTDFNHGADPFVLLVWLDLDEEEPFITFYLFHIFFVNPENISSSEGGLLG